MHNNIIAKVALDFFQKHGIYGRGKSRMWIDDQHWFAIVIEFQPSQHNKGTYLNIGANFHWYFQDYFSFDMGHRESNFVAFQNEQQFEKEIQVLLKRAFKRIKKIRKDLSDFKKAEKSIAKFYFSNDELWGNYHRGIIYGLNKKEKKASYYFDKILQMPLTTSWQKELTTEAQKLKNHLTDLNQFELYVCDTIKKTRTAKQLEKISP